MSQATIQEYLSEAKALRGDFEKVQKSLTQMSRSRSEVHDEIHKAISGGGMAVGIGYEGADEYGLLRINKGVNTRTIGRRADLGDVSFGEYIRAVAIKRSVGHQMHNPESDQWSDAVLKRCKAHVIGSSAEKAERVNKASLAEGSGATGGYTVPVQFYMDLMRLVAEESFVRQRCTGLPMQSRSMLIPALTQSQIPATGTSAYFGNINASWQPEAQTIAESDPTFRQIELVARDLVFTAVASNQLLQDNAVALDTLLTTLFKEAMAWFVDYYILRGTGAAQPLGVLNSPALISSIAASASLFTLTDAATMMSRLLMGSWKTAIWIAHPSVLPQLVTMSQSGTGSPLAWMSPLGGGKGADGGPAAQEMPWSMLGLPIYWTEKVPTLGNRNCVVLADLSKVILGDRLALQIEASPWPLFRQNSMIWRVIMRWDSQPWVDAPLTLAGTAPPYTMSPFVGS